MRVARIGTNAFISLCLLDSMFYQAFREIEEASARRALEEEEEEASHPGPLDPLVSALANNAELALAKKRRRQSISVSRVGSVSTFLCFLFAISS